MKIIDGIGSTEMLHIFISAADDDIVAGIDGRAGARDTRLPSSTLDGKPVPDR